MIQSLESSRLRPSYSGFEPTLLGWLNEIGTDREKESMMAIMGVEYDDVHPRSQLLDLHECLWDCIQYAVSRDLFGKARMFGSIRGKILKDPQIRDQVTECFHLEMSSVKYHYGLSLTLNMNTM